MIDQVPRLTRTITGRRVAALMHPRPVYLVTTCDARGAVANVSTISWITPLSHEPPLLGLSVRPKSRTHALIAETGQFVVNLVGESLRHAIQVCGNTSGWLDDKIRTCGLEIERGHRVDAPRLLAASAWLECLVVDHHGAGDHTLFIASVLEAGVAGHSTHAHSPEDVLLCADHDRFGSFIGEGSRRSTAAGSNDKEQDMTTFTETVADLDVALKRESLNTIQVNLGARCNQACIHCHVDAGPSRTETMGDETADLVLELVDEAEPRTVDLTGGAPELCPAFRRLVRELRARNVRVIDRSNLTVLLEDEIGDLPEFLAEAGVDIVASMPCYTQENVDAQRGSGVYEKSLEVLRRLNALGYGRAGTGLELDLVYNPLAASLPGPQSALEADYKQELAERAGLVFSHLYTITNVPLGRYAKRLEDMGETEHYANLLSSSFNPDTLSGFMCLNQVSVSWDGRLYDCDFNQVIGLPCGGDEGMRLGVMSSGEIVKRLVGSAIDLGEQCWACAAGSGSSCAGALA